jgi:hypothetical protein
MQGSRGPVKLSTKNTAVIIAIPLAVSFIFAAMRNFLASPTFPSIVVFGVGSVLTNLFFAFLYLFHYRKDYVTKVNSKITLVFNIMTLVIPFAIFYALFSLPFFDKTQGLGIFVDVLFCASIALGLLIKSKSKIKRTSSL